MGAEDHIIRVFELPDTLKVGYLFSGGVVAEFLQVDWMVDGAGAQHNAPENRAQMEAMIRHKRYYKPHRSYLVLHANHSFIVNPHQDIW